MVGDKAKAFREFAFDESSEWREYLSHVEIVNDSDTALLKLKAKWYRRHVDPEFDPALVPQSQPAPKPAPPPSTPASSAPRPAPKTFSAAPPAAGRATAHRPSRQTLALLHMAIILLTLLYVVSLLLARRWSARIFQLYCQLAVAANALHLYQRCGLPPVRRFSWDAFKMWAAQTLPSLQFHYIAVCAMFMFQQPVLTVMVSPTVGALYHSARYAREVLGHTPRWKAMVEEPYTQLMMQQNTALQLSAMSEVMTGFVTILNAVFTRTFWLPFGYFNLLRMQYASPEAGPFHRVAWQQIGRYVDPLLEKVPVLQRPAAWLKDWFTKPSRAV